MKQRDDFTSATKREIAERAGYVCSYPSCNRMTVSASSDRASGVTMIGVAAHIAAAAEGGERYDAMQSPTERKSASNGIWMCAIHGKWIDDNPSLATTEKLRAWKRDHEGEISAWVEHGYPGIAGSWDRLATLTRDQRETIETRLPNGHSVVRDAEHFVATLVEFGSCVVSGDSGVGKSALVKTALDASFPDVRQVWLGPDALRAVLSESERSTLGLTAPLAKLLTTSSAPQNILVIDAAERADAATVARLCQLMGTLKAEASRPNRWQFVIIAQQTGFEVPLDPILNAVDYRDVPISLIGRDQVRAALESVPALAHQAFDEAFVALLGNLRTLAWIIAAGPPLVGVGGIAARSEIADRLWSYWTDGDVDLHAFMIRLARRDAAYERSFALSDLSAEDRTAWKLGRARIPLALSPRNRLSFEHDLASDWARYQYLREVADDVALWAGLAQQPLWLAALQLFGQDLLRSRLSDGTAWDVAFASAKDVEAASAVDILLDALCLDPSAYRFLSERTAILFADKAKLLKRLLARFLHIATAPSSLATGITSDDGFYAEALMRAPVWANWPPVVQFMVAHRVEIAAFGSSIVAKFCEFWLTKTPPNLDGRLVLGRAGLAELAVETARVRQVVTCGHAFYGGDSDDDCALFTAALAGASDAPDLVQQFALEMAGRRPMSQASRAKVDALRADERARQRRAERASGRRASAQVSRSLFAPKKLPPWPLGPSGRVDAAFRKAVMRMNALTPMMRATPEVATEILLSCIVEDVPVEDMGAFSLHDKLGLDGDHDDRPTIYWNSPFFPFLVNAPGPAIDTLLRLLAFCTERWRAQIEGLEAPSIRLTLADGCEKEFFGDWRVLDWSHARESRNNQLFAALDALERWLWMKLRAGEDVRAVCGDLLARSGSAAMLGVMADCAKFRPALLKHVLAPLLNSPLLLMADRYRLGQRLGTDVFTWHRAGEQVRKMGLEWEQAAHRLHPLTEIIRALRAADPEFEEQVRIAVDRWPEEGPEMDLRQRALGAELDPANWHDASHSETPSPPLFRYPPELAAELEAASPPTSAPSNARAALTMLEGRFGTELTAEEVAVLHNALEGDRDEALQAFDPAERTMVETAIAALLVSSAWDWVVADADLFTRLVAILEQAVPAKATSDAGFDIGLGLPWACIGALYAHARDTNDRGRWERIISHAIASGEVGIIRPLIRTVRAQRHQLGRAYWIILETGVFAMCLEALRPTMDGEPGSLATLAGWRRRLARRPWEGSKSPSEFDLVALADRVDRLWFSRVRRISEQPVRPDQLRRWRYRHSLGRGTFVLGALFDWALDQDTPPPPEEIAEHRQILRMLWALQDAMLRGGPEDDEDDDRGFDRLDEFGLTVLRTMAARIPAGSVKESRPLWEPVLALGPRGEFTVEHLLDCFFLRLYKDIDPARFVANWDAMLAFVFAPEWADGGRWWRARSILRHMLGIDATSQIANSAPVLAHVASLSPYFEAFARDHIAHDDSSLAAFAHFLGSAAGRALRLQGVGWIDATLNHDASPLRNGAPAALADFARVVLTDHSPELIQHESVRASLLSIIARMVREQVPYALALQDRAKALR